MWIFTIYGFFSVTQTTRRADEIQIRARSRTHLEHLKNAFPVIERSPIVETREADYRFRIIVKRWKWEKLAIDLSKTITYSNFKGQVAKTGFVRNMLNELHDIWTIMFGFQNRMNPVDPMEGEGRLFREAGDPLFREKLTAGDWDIPTEPLPKKKK